MSVIGAAASSSTVLIRNRPSWATSYCRPCCASTPPRKKRLSLHRGVVPTATRADQHWSMDFVHDQLATGRAFRVLTVIDQWSRESVCLEANVSLTGQSVVDALEQVAQARSLPT
jgi:transposase InsO family protein